ncbi:MAG TPA: DNA gyrase inhibitor YacG [Usitatibacteraceae bacterium]|nr:DNA gyrase inhibitor YacG [Usitatibacteraceae bacterium]
MSAGTRRPERLVACPGCAKLVAYSPANPWRPFCSERCRQTDLGAWAAGAYRIPLRGDDPESPRDEGDEDGASGHATSSK